MTSVDLIAYRAHAESLQIVGRVVDFGENYVTIEAMNRKEIGYNEQHY